MMATLPIVPGGSEMVEALAEEPRLSPDETWDLIFRMYGSGKEMFAEFGGGEAFLRAERAAWTQHEPD